MVQRITVANQKGGVAKTTTTGAMAAALKRKGYKVLVVDLDPQGNLSESIGIEPDANEDIITMYQVIMGKESAADAIISAESFDIIPADIMLANAEIELVALVGREYRLKEALAPVEKYYDYIVIDTPPSLGMLTGNAFAYADEIIVPTTASKFSVKGIIQLYRSIEQAKRYSNPTLRIAGILVTRYNPQTVVGRQLKGFTEQIGQRIDAPIFKTCIRNGIVVEEAQTRGQDLFTYGARTNPAQDYDAFVDEYLEGEQNA